MARARPASKSSPAGTSRPVLPSSTTSGMPPTAEATTGVPQAIASRFTMPSGSYTEGQTNRAACVRSWITSGRGSILGIQNTPSRTRLSSPNSSRNSWSISGVSGAPAHSTTCAAGSMSRTARSR